MARNRNRNRNNRNINTSTNVDQGVSENIETPIEENEDIVDNQKNNESVDPTGTQGDEIIGDDVTNQNTSPPKEEETAEETSQDETEEVEVEVVEELIIMSDDMVVPSTEDTPKVAKLKEILSELKVALSGHGKTPEEFLHAAQLNATLVRYVMANYRPEVLDTLLAFYEENLDGVCRPTEFLKGSTTLSATEEQQVGLLHHLFYQLATKRFIKVNNSHVVNILKRPEIGNYFQRRMAGIKANR